MMLILIVGQPEYQISPHRQATTARASNLELNANGRLIDLPGGSIPHRFGTSRVARPEMRILPRVRCVYQPGSSGEKRQYDGKIESNLSWLNSGDTRNQKRYNRNYDYQHACADQCPSSSHLPARLLPNQFLDSTRVCTVLAWAGVGLFIANDSHCTIIREVFRGRRSRLVFSESQAFHLSHTRSHVSGSARQPRDPSLADAVTRQSDAYSCRCEFVSTRINPARDSQRVMADS
jgi:hypothetical protein